MSPAPPPRSTRTAIRSQSPTAGATAAEPQRLQKLLASRGLGARRQIDRWILEGRVVLNGRTACPGDRAVAGDEIRVDGRIVDLPAATASTRVLVYHKPVGELVTRDDPGERSNVFEHLPSADGGRWIAVGRLDLNSSGLLLLTTSGDLAHHLMHPRFGAEREYMTRVRGTIGAAELARLRSGVPIDGVMCSVKRIDVEDQRGDAVNRWYRVVLGEGRNREVRKLFEAVGGAVSRLIRVRYADERLPRNLEPGRWIELDRARVAALEAGSAGAVSPTAMRETRSRGIVTSRKSR